MLGKRPVTLLAGLLVVAVAAGSALAADILTFPSANQLRAGEVELSNCYLSVDRDSLIPPLRPLDIDFVRIQCMYVGLTDKVEVDAHRYDVDVLGAETIWNATYLIQQEDPERPAVVIGGRDLSRVYDNASYFVAAAKTLNPPVGGPPTEPIFRLHLGLGTEDNTLFGEPRHEGLFGGVQVVVQPADPMIGVVGVYDGQDVIAGVTCVPEPGWPTIKTGVFGGHYWIGASYTFNAQQ